MLFSKFIEGARSRSLFMFNVNVVRVNGVCCNHCIRHSTSPSNAETTRQRSSPRSPRKDPAGHPRRRIERLSRRGCLSRSARRHRRREAGHRHRGIRSRQRARRDPRLVSHLVALRLGAADRRPRGERVRLRERARRRCTTKRSPIGSPRRPTRSAPRPPRNCSTSSASSAPIFDMTDKQIATALGVSLDAVLTDMLAFCRTTGKKASRGEDDAALLIEADHPRRRAEHAPAHAQRRDSARIRHGRSHRPQRRRRRHGPDARHVRRRARARDRRRRRRSAGPFRRPRAVTRCASASASNACSPTSSRRKSRTCASPSPRPNGWPRSPERRTRDRRDGRARSGHGRRRRALRVRLALHRGKDHRSDRRSCAISSRRRAAKIRKRRSKSSTASSSSRSPTKCAR